MIPTPTFKDLPFEQVLIRHFTNEIQLRPQFIVFFLLDGSMHISLAGKTYTLQTHDIFFMKPGEIHSVPDTSSDIHVLGLFIDTENLHMLCPDIADINFEKHHIRYSQEDPVYTQLCTALADIIMYTLKKESSTPLKLLSGISSILITLLDAYGSKHLNNQENSSYVQQQLSLLLEYINSSYAEKITLSSAAEVLGFHPQYFSAFFKKHFHTTFIDYLTTLRVNKTLPLLAGTDQNITEIAVNHGFSSHKTYSAAFRRQYNMTPRDYRQQQQHILSNQNTFVENQNLDYFSYFQQYWNSDNSSQKETRVLQNHMTLTLPAAEMTLPLPPVDQKYCFSIGHAASILRSDIQKQIQAAQHELRIEALRIRDIFSDNLFIYYEDEEKHTSINWKYIDIIFDFLLGIGIKPFPEIGYMPRILASKKQYASWMYRPNVSIPKSFKKWSMLVGSFMEHLISRYGREEVLTWNFDFWTTANLNFRESYWNESKEDFFLFYRITYFSIKNVDPDIRLGSPDFSLPSGLEWYSDFIDYCTEYDLHPSYISLHAYNCEDDIPTTARNFLRFSQSWDEFPILSTSRDTAVQNIRLLQGLLKEKHWDHLKVKISNFNLSYLSRDFIRDTSFMAPYILYTSIQSLDIVDLLCFHSLSDVVEDFFIDNKPFHGGPGLMDMNGLKKSSYYAFYLLQRMGSHLVDRGDNYMLTRSEKGFQLLLFHYVYYDSLYAHDDHSSLSYRQRYNIYESSEELVIHSILPIPEGSYRIRETRLNRHHGSAYDLWIEMGSPEELDAEMTEYLQRKNCPEISYYMQESNGHLLFDTILQPHGVVLLEIEAHP